jgi:hypothetical protein
VQVTDDGRVADGFRLALSSSRIHVARFKGADIFAHKQFHPFSFTYEVAPAEIDFPVGKTATGWDSVAELVSSGKMLAIRNGPGAAFSEVWEKHAADASRPAASVRWAVVMDDEAGANLTLQGLPADAKRIKGIPVLKMDDAPTVFLHSTRLTHDRDRRVYPSHPVCRRDQAGGGGGGGETGGFLRGLETGVAALHHPRDGGPGGRPQADEKSQGGPLLPTPRQSGGRGGTSRRAAAHQERRKDRVSENSPYLRTENTEDLG